MAETATVLITGAGGFVMSNVTDVLLALGYAVMAVDHQFSPTLRHRWQDQAVMLIEADAANLPDIPADYAIHGAAITASPAERGETPEANLRANLLSLLALSEWAARMRVKRWVFISSAAVLGHHPAGALDEAALPRAEHTYGAAKLAGEAFVGALRREGGRDVVAARLSDIYGPFEQARPSRPRISAIGQMLHDALTTGTVRVPPPAHDPARDWTYAPDVGLALAALLTAPRLPDDVYHITAGQPVTLREVAALLISLLPDLRVEETQLAHPRPPRATCISTRLHAASGFDGWTRLADGLRTTLIWQRAVLEGVL